MVLDRPAHPPWLVGTLLASLFLITAPTLAQEPTAGELTPSLVEEDLIEEDLGDAPSSGGFDDGGPTADGASTTASAAGIAPPTVAGPAPLDDDAVLALFTEAEATYHSIDRPASLTQLSQLIDLFERHLADAEAARQASEAALAAAAVAPEPATPEAEPGAGDDSVATEPLEPAAVELPPTPPVIAFLSDLQRRVFARSLGARAVLYHDFGEDELATYDLERLLEVEPGANLEGLEAGDAVGRDFDALIKRRVARLAFAIEPIDAEIHIDGRRVDAAAGDAQPTLAGDSTVVVSRPGYATQVENVSLRAGRERTLEVTLERSSPVLRLVTRPAGAEVFVDGQPVMVTSGTAAADLLPNTGAYRPEEFSAEAVLDDVELGLRRLEIRKDGFRPYRAELMIAELLDYPVPPVVLEEERGVLVFRDLPSGAEVRIDDRPRQLENPGSSLPRLTLPPGEYGVTVVGGQSRMFSTRLLVADRQTVEVRVKLRPGIAFLGVLGADGTTAGDLDRGLRRVFDDTSSWAFLDRTELGPRVLAEAGATTDALRTLLDDGSVAAGLDWRQIQWSVDQRTPGLIYLAIVVRETLVDRRATLLVWSAAPGPALPSQVELPFGDAAAFEALRRRFDRPVRVRSAWSGLLLLDTPSSPHPVVGQVTPGSPAEAAGVVPGDAVVAVSGVPIFSGQDFRQRLDVAEIGEVVDLGVLGTGGPRNLRLTLEASPRSLDLENPDLLPAVAFNHLGQRHEEAAANERWLLRFDQALLLLETRDWEGAARLLRDVDAPQTSHGFGKAAVDYWRGVALSRLGADYREAARLALEQATRLPEARLDHNDGPWVAPRARARLQLLGGV